MHEDSKHCDPKALLATLRQFLDFKRRLNGTQYVQNCTHCTRARQKLYKQIIDNLPLDRVTEARPVLTSGVDYFRRVGIRYIIKLG